MALATRALTGKLLAQRYLVGELSRQTDGTTEFRGADTRTGGAVDIHVVREGLGANSHAARLLELDAMIASEIRHPNVPAPRDVGVLEDGSPFVITTRFEGETLEDRIDRAGALALSDVVRIGLDLLSAVAAAHDLRMTHGGLRPNSIFLVQRDGLVLQTQVSGFGRLVRADSRRRLGDTSFVAPELAAGGEPTVASDIYACGAIIYLAAKGLPGAPEMVRPELPSRLVQVLVQALQPNASSRHASARDMLFALENARGAFGDAAVQTRRAPESYTTLVAHPGPDTESSFELRAARSGVMTLVSGEPADTLTGSATLRGV
jgi:serine/threonine protein kinase